MLCPEEGLSSIRALSSNWNTALGKGWDGREQSCSTGEGSANNPVFCLLSVFLPPGTSHMLSGLSPQGAPYLVLLSPLHCWGNWVKTPCLPGKADISSQLIQPYLQHQSCPSNALFPTSDFTCAWRAKAEASQNWVWSCAHFAHSHSLACSDSQRHLCSVFQWQM